MKEDCQVAAHKDGVPKKRLAKLIVLIGGGNEIACYDASTSGRRAGEAIARGSESAVQNRHPKKPRGKGGGRDIH